MHILEGFSMQIPKWGNSLAICLPASVVETRYSKAMAKNSRIDPAGASLLMDVCLTCSKSFHPYRS